jgi:glycerol-3-phosphate cytidylyltransferase
MTYCFDLDNTLCETVASDYTSCRPIQNRIDKLNSLYDSGERIIIFTARGMSKYSGNLDLIIENLFEKTQNQLNSWGIKYHELIMGKPSYDFVIDDKNLLIEYFFEKEKIVGFIAGNFDIIHPGYIEMFEFTKNHCNHLIVALHTDPSIERLTKLKPILSVDERKKILQSIKYVDEILTYDTESQLIQILKNNKIDVRFLGDDYKNKKYTGSELSIPIIFVNRDHDWSTTKLKKKISENII